MKIIWIAAALLALAVPAARAEIVPGSSIRIVDGDTVRLGRERIRLLGPDAPEIRDHAHCPAERAAGRRAAARLGQILRGHPVDIERRGQDEYHRTLAILTVDGRNVGAQMIAEGLALRWTPGWRAHRARTTHWCGPGDW